MPVQAFTSSYSRMWFQDGGPSPARAARYYSAWRAGAVTWGRGDLTVIREPDPNSYNRFIRVGRHRGEPRDPEMPITARYNYERSALLKAARGDCEHALQLHIGQCENPQDFARGWEKVLILEGAAINTYATQELGALEPSQNAPVNEDVRFVGTDLYEVMRLSFAEQAKTLVTREIVSVYVCDRQQCGQCGVPSDGCQLVLALEGAVSASPGLAPAVIYTSTGGAVWAESAVSTLAANQRADAVFCAGPNTVVLSSDDDALHWADTALLILGGAAWTRVAAGFVAAKGPTAIFSIGATENWIAGLGGYVYFTDDPTNGVTVSTAGSATTENLHAIHAFDSLNIVAVGANNAVLATQDGGVAWTLVVGPRPGQVLNTVFMHGQLEWLVGTADGRLYYTIDGGATWAEKLFSGSGTGQVRSVVFATPSVGYMAHSTAAPAGRVLRTLDGGHSWYVLPEGTGSIPTNDYVASLAVCDDPNIAYMGGLGANGVDGFLVKAA